MSGVCDASDTAMGESFFATLECALIEHFYLRTPEKADTVVFEFIEGRCNLHRRHSTFNMESSIENESSHRGVTQDTGRDLSTITG
jgi:putative transposase